MLDNEVAAMASIAVIAFTAVSGFIIYSLVAFGIKKFKRWRKKVNRC